MEAAWLQTRLYPQTREDIATYVISAATGSVAIDLASTNAAPLSCEVRVDGDSVSADWQGAGRIIIDLGDATAGRRLVEIRTTAAWGGTAAGFGLPWPVQLDPPAFPN